MEVVAFPERFYLAAAYVGDEGGGGGRGRLSDERRLLLSALYLQATRGPLVVERDGDAPAAWRIVERARWQAWRQLGGMPQTQAMWLYVQTMEEELVGGDAWIGEAVAEGLLDRVRRNAGDARDAAAAAASGGSQAVERAAAEVAPFGVAAAEVREAEGGPGAWARAVPGRARRRQASLPRVEVSPAEGPPGGLGRSGSAESPSHSALFGRSLAEDRAERFGMWQHYMAGRADRGDAGWRALDAGGEGPGKRHGHAAAVMWLESSRGTGGAKGRRPHLVLVGGSVRGKGVSDVRSLALEGKELVWRKRRVVALTEEDALPGLVGLRCAAVDGARKLLVVGGAGRDGGLQVRVLDAVAGEEGPWVWRLLPVTGVAPTARSEHGVAVVGPAKAGGALRGRAGGRHDSNASVNPEELSGYSLGGSLLVVGGQEAGTRRALGDVHKLDLQTLRWYRLSPSDPPFAGLYGHATFVYGDRLFVTGGCLARRGSRTEQEEAPSNETHALDLARLEWSPFEAMAGAEATGGAPYRPSPRSGGAGVLMGSLYAVLGGGDGARALSDVAALDLATRRWARLDAEAQSGGYPLKVPGEEALAVEGLSLLTFENGAVDGGDNGGGGSTLWLLAYGGYDAKGGRDRLLALPVSRAALATAMARDGATSGLAASVAQLRDDPLGGGGGGDVSFAGTLCATSVRDVEEIDIEGLLEQAASNPQRLLARLQDALALYMREAGARLMAERRLQDLEGDLVKAQLALEQAGVPFGFQTSTVTAYDERDARAAPPSEGKPVTTPPPLGRNGSINSESMRSASHDSEWIKGPARSPMPVILAHSFSLPSEATSSPPAEALDPSLSPPARGWGLTSLFGLGSASSGP